MSELLYHTNYLLSEKKTLLSGGIDLNPGPEEIPILFTYGRRFMFSSSSYFWNCAGQQVFADPLRQTCVKSRARFRINVIHFSSVQCWRLLYTDEAVTREVVYWYQNKNILMVCIAYQSRHVPNPKHRNKTAGTKPSGQPIIEKLKKAS